jgi:hypothetical protein
MSTNYRREVLAWHNENNRFDNQYGTTQTRHAVVVTWVAALLTVSVALGASPLPSSVPTDESVEALALQWFGEMRMGQIDRTQLAVRNYFIPLFCL